MKRSIVCLSIALVVSMVIVAGAFTNVSQRVLAGPYTPRFAAPLPAPITASSIQRWSVTNGFYALNIFGDGTILAASDTFVSGAGSGVQLDPRTGAVIRPFSGPDVRTSIRLSSGASARTCTSSCQASRSASASGRCRSIPPIRRSRTT